MADEGGKKRWRQGGTNGLAGRKPVVRARTITVKVRGVFLDALAALCDVRAAAAVAERMPSCFYELRRRDARFAEQWLEALTIGYESLEADLVAYARGRTAEEDVGGYRDPPVTADADGATKGKVQPGTGLGPDGGVVPARIQVGLLLLARHRASLNGGKPIGRGSRPVTAAETDAVLTKRLDQLARSIRGAA